MGQIFKKSVSQLEKFVTLKKTCHSLKKASLFINVLQFKKMGHIKKKCVTVGKMGHT